MMREAMKKAAPIILAGDEEKLRMRLEFRKILYSLN